MLFSSSLTSLPCSRCKFITVARGWNSLTRGCPGTGVRLLNVTRKEIYTGVTPPWICPGAAVLCLHVLCLYVVSLRTESPALEDDVAPCVGQAEVMLPCRWVGASLLRQPSGDLTWWDEFSSLGSLQMFVVIIRKCANTPINLIDVKSWLGRKLIFSLSDCNRRSI